MDKMGKSYLLNGSLEIPGHFLTAPDVRVLFRADGAPYGKFPVWAGEGIKTFSALILLCAP